MKKMILLSSLLTAVVLLAGCAPELSPNVYYADQLNTPSEVRHGVILDVRPIRINNSNGVGTIAGTAAGAAAGSLLGGNTATSIVGAVGGGLVGGIIGQAADRDMTGRYGYEYIIRLSTGRTISVAQANRYPFYVGQRILVIYGARTRVIPDTME